MAPSQSSPMGSPLLSRYMWSPSSDGITRLSPAARIFFYGLVGWAIEVTFTAIVDHIEQEPDHFKLTGTTYLWMFLIWGIAFYASELEAKAMTRRGWIFPIRWIVYMSTAWAFEYVTGYLIRRYTGACPWDYTQADSNIHGLIRLDYGVFWICTGTLSEWMHPMLDSITLIDAPKSED